MNKQQKIIVSIVGITIVLLALLGITYAYYLTRIEGNTNTNSISITTADLKLVYSENSPEIITENNIMPGTTIGEKNFTVSNTGNTLVEDYKVVLEYAVIENVVPSVFVRPQDFEITLTCVSKNIQTDEESGTCSGYTGKWNNESFEMTTNDIADNIKHEYTLTIFYANPDIDQSDDMGKNLNLKVQIYGANETSTITGTIDNVDETYAMKLNSNPKISTIKNVGTKENPKYQYKFIGVEPNTGNDSHTLTLVNKSNVEQSTGNITIKKGTNSNIDGSTITVKDNQTNIFLTTTNGSSLTNSATFNPYSDNTNTLAYHIINNAINKTNGTMFVDAPLTKPGKQTSLVTNYKTTGEESSFLKSMSRVNYNTSAIWYYYDAFEIDSTTGEFTLTGKQSCTYSSCYNGLVGKYLYSEFVDDNISAYQNSSDKKTNLTNIYKVIETTSSTLTYVGIFNSPNEAERVMASTTDDYGISYYYRGNIEDNYVNFAGMCWRIVRIEGDGSIKLILEDAYAECNDNETETTSAVYTGNWSDGKFYEFGYDSSFKTDFLNYSGGLSDSFKTFQINKLTTNDLEKLKVDDWCYDNNVTKVDGYEYYGSFLRIYTNKKPSLNCFGTKLTKFRDNTDMYVGTLTADEMSFAGVFFSTNYNSYLMNNYSKYFSEGASFWSLSPSYSNQNSEMSSAFTLNVYGYFDYIDAGGYSRPSITLNSGSVILSGNGIRNNPYIIG